ncbi:MAG: hypothetical protein ACJ76H_00960 [Bacteriovoracaceae bacterium]
MKKFIVLGLLMSTTLMAAPLPKELKCTSNGTSENVRSFSIVGLATTHPDLTITDASPMGFEIRDGVMSIGVSNECDNDYGLEISINELDEYLSGKRATVTGKLTYSDVSLSEARNTEEAVEETVEITCRR